jgi:hypothetical protein
VARAEKALADVTDADALEPADIGGDGCDARDEIRAASRHLRNATRIADLHERDLAVEVVKADREMDHG